MIRTTTITKNVETMLPSNIININNNNNVVQITTVNCNSSQENYYVNELAKKNLEIEELRKCIRKLEAQITDLKKFVWRKKPVPIFAKYNGKMLIRVKSPKPKI